MYNLLCKRKFVSFPITHEAEVKLDAIVANVNGRYFGRSLYETAEEKVVAYLYFLINDHPFTDGNKRTAALSFLVVCDLNDLEPQFRNFSLDELSVFIEKTTVDHQEMIRAIAQLLFSEPVG